MANEEQRDERSDATQASEYVKGGKGRKDEVGRSGIYPASAPDAPVDAEIRTEGELVAHRGPRTAANEDNFKKTDESSGSE
jgi:hypothetical protein